MKFSGSCNVSRLFHVCFQVLSSIHQIWYKVLRIIVVPTSIQQLFNKVAKNHINKVPTRIQKVSNANRDQDNVQHGANYYFKTYVAGDVYCIECNVICSLPKKCRCHSLAITRQKHGLQRRRLEEENNSATVAPLVSNLLTLASQSEAVLGVGPVTAWCLIIKLLL